MRKQILLSAILIIAVLAFVFSKQHQPVAAQQRAGLTPEQIAQRNQREQELESVAIIDRKLMIPMRDGKRMAADVYRPKDSSKKYPTVFVRTPYNFNFWDVRNGVPRDMSNEVPAIGDVLRGDRVTVRDFEEADRDPLLAMRREPEIVVRRKVDHRFVVERGVCGGLAFEYAQLAIQALLLEAVHFGRQERQRVGAH